jgi:hypothetical protein
MSTIIVVGARWHRSLSNIMSTRCSMNARVTVALVTILTPAASPGVAAQERALLPTTDRPLHADVSPQFTVGGRNAPDWAAFTRIDAAAFDSAGDLYLLDARNQRVIVVGKDGRLIREIGRKGGGPGEFAAPRAIAVFPDGGLVVLDVLQRRLSWFGPDGALVRDFPSAVGAGAPRTIFPSGDEAVVGDVRTYLLDGQVMTRTSEGLRPAAAKRPIQRYPVTPGEEPQVLYRADLVTGPRDPQGQRYLTAFFHDFAMTALPDGRVALADTSAYRLTVVGEHGGVERVLVRPLPDRPVTDADRDAERRRLLDNLADGRPPQATVYLGDQRPSKEEVERRFRQQIDDMRFPATYPHVATLSADGEGRLWVERYGHPPAEPGPIDVITPNGTYVGTLPAGQPGMPIAFGPQGLAAFVDLDALDVPTVRVVRIRLNEP